MWGHWNGHKQSVGCRWDGESPLCPVAQGWASLALSFLIDSGINGRVCVWESVRVYMYEHVWEDRRSLKWFFPSRMDPEAIRTSRESFSWELRPLLPECWCSWLFAPWPGPPGIAWRRLWAAPAQGCDPPVLGPGVQGAGYSPGCICIQVWVLLEGDEQLFFFFFNAAEKLVCTQQRECLQHFYSSKAFCFPSWPGGRGDTQVASRLSAEAGWTWVNGCEPDSIFSQFCLLQFSSVAQSCLTLCNPMDCSTSDFPVHHQLPDFAQTHIHQVSDAIRTSHPLLSPSPPAFNLSQHQGLFQGVRLCIRWLKYCSFSFSISASSDCSGLISFSMDWFDVLAVQGTLKSLVSYDLFLFCSSTAWT